MSAAINRIRNVAIVGVTGTVGQEITKALLAGGKHSVTAITRGGQSLPQGVTEKKVTYDKHESIVEALRGQDILIVSLNPQAPRDTQTKLIDAAKDAGVKWIMPNEWGFAGAQADEQFGKDIVLGTGIAKTRAYIKEQGLSFVGLACGFWYEFSLGGGEARYGFDFPGKKLTLFDDGNTKILTSTLPSCGTAVAKLLTLPVEPEDGNDKSLSQWRNDSLYVSSFFVSQNDMFDSVLRVTGDKRSDWTVHHEDSVERFERNVKLMEKGDMPGFVARLYTRVFWKDGKADFTAQLQNKLLDLPRPDLDEWTKKAIDMAMSGGTAY